MTTLFISDLHLSEARPEKLALFRQLLTGPALQVDTLYILGDLFEAFWIGIDDKRPPNPEIIAILKNYSTQANTKLVMIRGNRDFHLDARFASATGCSLVDDPQVISVDDDNVLIMHGDTLCTDDKDYQRWRKFINHSVIKWMNLRLPFSIRKKISTDVRSYTVEQTKNKSSEITDVNESTVIQEMEKHQVKILIHGHTHRQAMHDVNLSSGSGKRIVLGDWYKKDSILIKDTNGYRFERVADYISNN
ncbi:MAG: UDP-2,3-diacylglucosamine diphosphatase [Pseudomonadota bacterium]